VFDQGTGEINILGAVKLATLVRRNLTASTPVGAPMLTTDTPPAPRSTIADYTFTWAQGILLDHTYATGVSLITNYQKVYGDGFLLSDGISEQNGGLVILPTMLSSGITLGSNVLLSTGIVLSEGTPVLSMGVLLNEGVILTDGVIVSDGTLLSYGTLLSDGTLLADYSKAAETVLANGDNTGAMSAVADSTNTRP